MCNVYYCSMFRPKWFVFRVKPFKNIEVCMHLRRSYRYLGYYSLLRYMLLFYSMLIKMWVKLDIKLLDCRSVPMWQAGRSLEFLNVSCVFLGDCQNYWPCFCGRDCKLISGLCRYSCVLRTERVAALPRNCNRGLALFLRIWSSYGSGSWRVQAVDFPLVWKGSRLSN